MIIHKTYDYLSNTDRILISQDLAEVSVHSIRFDRYYTESEKQVNLQAAEMMSKEEYSAHCKGVSELYKGKMETILKEFVGKYNIHQVSEETSTMVHYHSDWDLFYGTNEAGDFFTLTFNKKRTPAANLKLLDELLDIVSNLHVKNVQCIVQYTSIDHVEEINQRAKEIYLTLENKWVSYRGDTGRIRIVDSKDGCDLYGFSKKGAHKNYITVPPSALVVMGMSKTERPGVIVLKKSGWQEIHYQRREFKHVSGSSGLSFVMKDGEPVFQCDKAKENYEYALAHPEEYKDVGVKPHIEKYWENTTILCKCGNELELRNELHGACRCPNCGKWYNMSGQELLPPDEWIEEVGV